MTEAEIRMLALTDRAEAIASARLGGFDELALEIELLDDLPVEASTPTSPGKHGRGGPTLFQYLAGACFTMREASRESGVPYSTVQAAGVGRTAGGTTFQERQRVLKFLKSKQAALEAAIAICEQRGGRHGYDRRDI